MTQEEIAYYNTFRSLTEMDLMERMRVAMDKADAEIPLTRNGDIKSGQRLRVLMEEIKFLTDVLRSRSFISTKERRTNKFLNRLLYKGKVDDKRRLAREERNRQNAIAAKQRAIEKIERLRIAEKAYYEAKEQKKLGYQVVEQEARMETEKIRKVEEAMKEKLLREKMDIKLKKEKLEQIIKEIRQGTLGGRDKKAEDQL